MKRSLGVSFIALTVGLGLKRFGFASDVDSHQKMLQASSPFPQFGTFAPKPKSQFMQALRPPKVFNTAQVRMRYVLEAHLWPLVHSNCTKLNMMISLVGP